MVLAKNPYMGITVVHTIASSAVLQQIYVRKVNNQNMQSYFSMKTIIKV